MKFGMFDSFLGTVVLLARTSHMCRLDLFPSGAEVARKWIAHEFPEAVESSGPFMEVVELLRRYFDGEPVEFNIPLDIEGLGEFTGRVLAETRKVPYGKTASYGTIATRLGYRGAARAVGQALHRNPVPVVIPCHRIVNKDGSLGGFGLGLDMKIRLLAREGVSAPELRATMMLS
jgi:methylated-DNA-[protein]-cysteine S-methyltransferase